MPTQLETSAAAGRRIALRDAEHTQTEAKQTEEISAGDGRGVQ
jgi:hypothetical protein